MSAVAASTLADELVRDSFGVLAGELTIGGIGVRTLVSQYGSPLYVYDGDRILQRYRALTNAVRGFAEVYYSVKANPNPAVARLLVDAGAGLEIASGAEYMLARSAGAAPDRILFAGPGKGAAELERTIASGIGEIHLETTEEIGLVAEIGARLNRKVPVSIRINPAAAAQGGAMRMGGRPAAFGFDEEILDEILETVRARPQLSLKGIHLFAGTQILDAKVLIAQWRYGIELAARCARKAGRPLSSIDLGGGLGIPYHFGDATLDLAHVEAAVPALTELLRSDPLLAEAQVIIEPGRYLTGPAGVYLTSVRSVKRSRESTFVICDGGMHHHLAASGNLGQVIKRDYPIVPASRMDCGEVQQAFVVGPLCTPLDTLGRQSELPSLAAGDILGVLQSGAYGLSASPVGFLSHPMPAEVLVRGGTHQLIRQAGSFDAPLSNLRIA